MRKKASPTDLVFSEIVRKARKHRIDKSNFTSSIVADTVNIRRATYSRKETGKSPWTLTEAIAVCKFLGIKNIQIEEL
jgi:DNA-binding XRE family transcriptional regulator